MMHKLHWSEPYVHVVYCGAVFIEGHGLYAIAAGVLGTVMIVVALFGGNDP